MWHDIRTAAQAIELLRGPAAVARLFKQVQPNTVSMWARRKRFPPKTWIVLAPRLRREGGRFSPRLFDMLEPRGGHDGHR